MKNFKDRDFLLKQKDLILLDVRFDMSNPKRGMESYRKSHAKGAGYLDLDKDLAGPVKKHGGRHPLPDQDEFQEKLRALGVSNDSKVLIYDDGDNSTAGRLWWMLKYYGLEDVFVLHGGFSTLQEEDLTDRKESFPRGNITLKPDDSMTASYEEVLAYSKDDASDDKVVVDSRSAERYKGITEPIDIKKGHIRNAANICYRSHFNESNHIDLEALQKNFQEITGYDDVIFHCGSGVTACTNIMAFDEIGKKSRLYIGSFSDFVSYEENTVERE
ncbi:sulfurtransferase [Proteiniclasticum sp. C24MP]|uniref:sulfurtransferase n=1 Tax=Proteiniclasticum sp. C24MP TaxID=3374101 RepID=UPI0037544059